MQSSSDSDYNMFLENLMNKRRQIADANPKNTTHFSGNSMGSNNGVQSPVNSCQINPELRTTKSIIIGAGQPIIVPGQPIIVPGQRNNVTESKQVKPSPNVALSKTVSNEALMVAQSVLTPEQAPSRPVNLDSTVTSVEEFCPDGGTLDKGFLDDLPTASTTEARQSEANCDSDSDENDTGNPLVAKFHEDPFDDLCISKNPVKAQAAGAQNLPQKVNPLAKNRSKGLIPNDLGLVLTPKRRNSTSSDDTEIPTILKTKANDHSSDQSNEEFDSWLADTNHRRSPEGGEDETSLPSIDKTAVDAVASITVHTKRLELSDEESDKHSKDKSSKSKKKKKEKKEKKDKGDKEKKRSKSKKSHADELLSEHKEPSGDQNAADDDLYEAL